MKKIIQRKQYPFKHSCKCQLQTGLSLIELLISMVIGLFLLGGVIANFIGTKDSDKTRFAISEMDDNARSALSIMRQSIAHAGYSSVYNMRLEKGFFSQRDLDLASGSLINPVCGDGSTLRDNSESTPDLDQRTRHRSRGDVITVVVLADNPCRAGLSSCASSADINPKALVYTDCAGGGSTRGNRSVACSADPLQGMENDGLTGDSNAKIYSTFRLGGGANSRTLYCDGSRGGTQPLVDNVEAMQILYGIKMDDDTIIYQDADSVEANDQWGLVRSVQVALLMRSSKQYILKVDSDKTRYTLLDEAWEIADADLRRLFRVYTTTINLENPNKGPLL